MKRRQIANLLLALFLGSLSTIAGPLNASPLEDAQQKAKADKKILVIDFYTTWCGPCKLLDTNTWTDKAVAQLLGDKSIFLKIDAEKEKALASRYKIAAYPTVLLLKADGTEIDRLVGYRPPEEFISDFNAALSGKDTVARAKAGVEKAGTNDPMARMKLGRALAEKQDFAAALQEYLWCFDKGGANSEFAGVRLSFLLSDLKALGKNYPPAIQALSERRNEKEEAIVAGTANAITVMELIALNETLDQKERSLSLYDRLSPDNRSRKILSARIAEQLILARRYDDILQGVDPEALFKKEVAQTDQVLAMFPKDNPMRQQVEAVLRDKTTATGLIYFEALSGTHKDKEAATLADQITKFDSSAAVHEKLISAAKRAGNSGTSDLPKSAK